MNPRPGALDPPTPEGPPHRAPGWKVRGGSGATGSRNAADTGSRQRQPADRCGEGARASALRGGEVRAPPIGRRSGSSGCRVAPCPASFVSGQTWSRGSDRRLPTHPLRGIVPFRLGPEQSLKGRLRFRSLTVPVRPTLARRPNPPPVAHHAALAEKAGRERQTIKPAHVAGRVDMGEEDRVRALGVKTGANSGAVGGGHDQSPGAFGPVRSWQPWPKAHSGGAL